MSGYTRPPFGLVGAARALAVLLAVALGVAAAMFVRAQFGSVAAVLVVWPWMSAVAATVAYLVGRANGRSRALLGVVRRPVAHRHAARSGRRRVARARARRRGPAGAAVSPGRRPQHRAAASGWRQTEMAAAAVMSETGMNMRIHRIRVRYNLRTNEQLVAWAYQHRLLVVNGRG